MFGARNSSQINKFFTRGRREDLDIYYISQSCFALPGQSIRNNSDRLILLKQTIRDVQTMYYDMRAYDMKYDAFKECVMKLGMKNLTIFVLIWLKIETQVNIVLSMKAKPHIMNAFVRMKLFKAYVFKTFNCCLQ